MPTGGGSSPRWATRALSWTRPGLELFFDDVQMVKGGIFAGGDAEARGTQVLQRKEFTVTVDLHLGKGEATVYTSDLSYEYVKINADYRT